MKANQWLLDHAIVNVEQPVAANETAAQPAPAVDSESDNAQIIIYPSGLAAPDFRKEIGGFFFIAAIALLTCRQTRLKPENLRSYRVLPESTVDERAFEVAARLLTPAFDRGETAQLAGCAFGKASYDVTGVFISLLIITESDYVWLKACIHTYCEKSKSRREERGRMKKRKERISC